MNLTQLIKNNSLFFEVRSFLMQSNWLPVSYEDMDHHLHSIQYHNTTSNFVCFRKQLLGDVPAYIFICCGRYRSKTYVVFVANRSIKLRNSYGLTQFGRFHIDYRSFVIRNSNQY